MFIYPILLSTSVAFLVLSCVSAPTATRAPQSIGEPQVERECIDLNYQEPLIEGDRVTLTHSTQYRLTSESGDKTNKFSISTKTVSGNILNKSNARFATRPLISLTTHLKHPSKRDITPNSVLTVVSNNMGATVLKSAGGHEYVLQCYRKVEVPKVPTDPWTRDEINISKRFDKPVYEVQPKVCTAGDVRELGAENSGVRLEQRCIDYNIEKTNDENNNDNADTPVAT